MANNAGYHDYSRNHRATSEGCCPVRRVLPAEYGTTFAMATARVVEARNHAWSEASSSSGLAKADAYSVGATVHEVLMEVPVPKPYP